ncbi:DUF397 domain-containing protein [Streptomyces sp. NPDC004232]|uniref:DUF397 domain-containing protein n=1 Tax=Streptomyces sp. NPDC004232 TaxID=3154454 RepID=UPI0033ACEE3E
MAQVARPHRLPGFRSENWPSFSDSGGNNCVEVTTTPSGQIALRESDAPTTILTTSRAALRALVRATRSATQEDL